MEEIGVIVEQQIGSISWNYEDIKNKLKQELEVYKKTVYTDETIKTAKNDVASLRKLAKDIEDRRKEVKVKCLEPYNMIESQAKELVSLIDEPIKAINSQVEDYEKRRKEAVRKEIEAFWQKESASLPEDLRQKAHDSIYDTRWENATTTKKTWKEGIQKGIQGINIDMETIHNLNSDFEEDMMAVYKKTLSLQEAISKMTVLNEQRERVKEIERKKQEEAEKEPVPDFMPEPVQPDPEPVPVVPQKVPEQKKETQPEPPGNVEEVITIIGTREQVEKIKKFITYTGAKWKEGANGINR
jgi:hypothetical protein